MLKKFKFWLWNRLTNSILSSEITDKNLKNAILNSQWNLQHKTTKINKTAPKNDEMFVIMDNIYEIIDGPSFNFEKINETCKELNYALKNQWENPRYFVFRLIETNETEENKWWCE